ncbi:hypothetical protein [Pedobacter frigoris]|nr:hypothetical protein [Pedobacter frigoris]
MPLVARIISFSANKEENGKWIKEHEQQLKDFSKWMTTESLQRS